jgi:hypothetical protein
MLTVMVVRIGKRIEVRLDDAHREALSFVLESRGLTVTEWVRDRIEAERERIRLAEFEALLQSLQDDPVDWGSLDEVSAETAHAHCPGAEFCGEPDRHG